MGKSQKSTLVFDPVLRTFIDSSMKEKDNSIVCREIKSIPQKDWDKCIERCKDILKEADFRESRALRRVASMYLLLLCFSFRYITSVTDIIDGNLRSILRALVKNRAEAIQLTRSPASENAMAWFEWLLKNPPDAPNG